MTWILIIWLAAGPTTPTTWAHPHGWGDRQACEALGQEVAAVVRRAGVPVVTACWPRPRAEPPALHDTCLVIRLEDSWVDLCAWEEPLG